MDRKRLLVRLVMACGLGMAPELAPGLVAGIAVPALAESSAASTHAMKLLKLGVVGNKQVPTAAIDQGMTVSVGQKVTRADLAANFKAIVEVYRRANVGASFKQKMTIPHPGQVLVEYIIAEESPLPPPAAAVLRLDRLTFEGNKQVASDKIQSAITLKPGDVVTNDNVTANTKAIVAVYKKAGIGAQITPAISYPQPNHVVVDYKIDEKTPG